MLNIAFRADSSYEIGTGHIMRCLTLALAVQKKHKANIYFFTRKNSGSINSLITDAGFYLVEMKASEKINNPALSHSAWLGAAQEEDAEEFIKLCNKRRFDLLIIDHYAIDRKWHQLVNKQTKEIAVIDDLGDRYLQCDYLLDQTFNCPDHKYNKLVSRNCVQMLGTKFALLRDEFQHQPQKQPANTASKLLVMFGGTDPDNLTLQALTQLNQRTDIDKITIIMGRAALHIDSVVQFIEKQNNIITFDLQISPENIAVLMSEADLAVGAAGTTSWERCAAGLPTVVIIQAENQRQIASELNNLQIITYLEAKQIKTLLNKQVTEWISNPAKLQASINNGQKICDGYGASRVINRIFNHEQ
ncbi:UDP-2,4-diacetamido-2,4,6-trideoxy-beta-L-altropyranose hydrolase [Psychromonas ossibalaenae]|uniref:UDP-2,4-diacetamido-2,4, 6-trideoxy-beta-L-altropyranose hydrolase n=1 Tax=Psychromonas ossibalaenae TaxID=444922 RepID=UPI0003755AF7|nr:UDP-2,4-diacetamido-2,4,6-trideoxy-beta-L-altropyranose hydrolase [Psychromonas ossibalaenae]